MAKQGITTGSTPNDGTGDTLLAGAVKINSNFDEIYNYFGNGSNLNFTSVVWPSNDTGIHTTSKVGIGTTTASEQLTVSGNISVPDDKYSYYGTSNDLKIRHNTALGNEISNLNDEQKKIKNQLENNKLDYEKAIEKAANQIENFLTKVDLENPLQ